MVARNATKTHRLPQHCCTSIPAAVLLSMRRATRLASYQQDSLPALVQSFETEKFCLGIQDAVGPVL